MTESGPRSTGRDPEEVLSQALRAMAGGSRPDVAAGGSRPGVAAGGSRPDMAAAGGRRPESAAGGPGRSWWARLTAVQVVLLALIAGVSIGMTAGIIVLLVR